MDVLGAFKIEDDECVKRALEAGVPIEDIKAIFKKAKKREAELKSGIADKIRDLLDQWEKGEIDFFTLMRDVSILLHSGKYCSESLGIAIDYYEECEELGGK